MNVNYPSGGIASLLSSQGRDGDSMLIHMSPNEVQGLQNLAMAAGGSLSINPQTGLYEASFLKKLLPTLLGVGLSFIPGVGPLAAAGLVGAGETIRTGDLGKGLMAGLGAYGGAGLTSGLAGMGSLAKAGADKVALQQTLGGEAAKSTLQTAAQQAAKEGVKSYGSNILGGIKSIGDVGLGATAKGLGSTLGATGVMGLGSNVMSAMTPDMQMPKGTEQDNLYYISEGYDPEKGFLGGQYVKQYPGLPTGYAEGGEVSKEDARQAALQQYMADLNKFVTGAGPNAPRTSPTYVPPPAQPQQQQPPPPPPPPPAPTRTTGPFDGFDPNNFNWDALSNLNIDSDILRQMQDGTFNPFSGRFTGEQKAQATATTQPSTQQTAATSAMQGYDPTAFQYDPFVSGYGDANMGGMANMAAAATPATATPATPAPSVTDTETISPDYGMEDYLQDYGLNPDNFGDFNYANMQMYAGGGQLGSYSDGGRMLRGPGDGMSDSIPAEIRGRRGRQPARLADGEFVVPADVVSHLGNGSTEAGSRKLYKMMDNIRRARTGKTRQAPQVRAEKYLPRKQK